MSLRVKQIRVCVLLFSIMLMASCQGDEMKKKGVPLPVGWPRIPISVADTMISVKGSPVEVKIHPEATYSMVEGDTKGLTVTYPRAGAQIYYTFIKPKNAEDRQKIIEARKTRIGLNLSGASAQTEHATTGSAVMIVATSGVQTPVQLLADTPDYVITATAFLTDPRAAFAYDSIRPLIDVLKHDMQNSLNGIEFKEQNR